MKYNTSLENAKLLPGIFMPCGSFSFSHPLIFLQFSGRNASMSFKQAAYAAKTRKSPTGICTRTARTASIGCVRTHPHFCNLSFRINRQKFACKGITPPNPLFRKIAIYGIVKNERKNTYGK